MTLRGKSIILTGAAGGLGEACARRYIADGAHVVLVDRDERVEKLAGELGAAAVPVVADVATREGNDQAVAIALRSAGGLDAVHVNAAVQVVAPIDETTMSDWNAMHEVNLRAGFLAIQAAVAPLRQGGGGAILLTASVLGMVGDGALVAYGAMKGGLIAMSRATAVAEGQFGIRCNTICPADVETPMVREYFASLPAGERDRIVEQYPLGRIATPADVAAAAAFLMSDDAGFITGVDLVVDGGLLARVY